MLRKFLLIFTFAIIALTSTSCIELIEEIWIKEDKTGTISLRFEANAIGGLINLAGDYISPKMRESLMSFPEQSKTKLAKVDGISNVVITNGLKRGLVEVKYDFESEKALNKSLFSILGMNQKWYHPDVINYSSRKFAQRNVGSIIRRNLEADSTKTINKNYLKYVKYRNIIHLPGKIKKLKNPESKKIDENTYELSFQLDKLFSNEADIGSKAKFEKE